MSEYRIAVVPGDGIGEEVIHEAIRVVDRAADLYGFRPRWDYFDWGCEYFQTNGQMAPAGFLDRIRDYDAIFLGAVGSPEVPDHISLWGLLIPIRRSFDQYINLRPVKLFSGVRTPLADKEPGSIDYVIVRENVEGEYSKVGGRLYEGTDSELAVQESVFTRRGVDRALRYAFQLSESRPARHLTSATKSNGIVHTMPFWDERFHVLAEQFPQVSTSQFHIDILTAHLVQRPEDFDVIVASNLFGDILSDLGPATVGSIGIAPSGNINPEGVYPSMFEPVHGSAPDIAGQGIANPIAQIWSGAMMLRHLGEIEAAAAIEQAFQRVLAAGGWTTRDLGGTATTSECASAVCSELEGTSDEKPMRI